MPTTISTTTTIKIIATIACEWVAKASTMADDKLCTGRAHFNCLGHVRFTASIAMGAAVDVVGIKRRILTPSWKQCRRLPDVWVCLQLCTYYYYYYNVCVQLVVVVVKYTHLHIHVGTCNSSRLYLPFFCFHFSPMLGNGKWAATTITTTTLICIVWNVAKIS